MAGGMGKGFATQAEAGLKQDRSPGLSSSSGSLSYLVV